MKTSLFILIATALVPFFAGCASQPVALPPVGPAPTGQTSTPNHPASGYLQVFSDTETHYIGDGPAFYPHRGYNVYDSANRKVVKYVPNHIGDMDTVPTLVRIPEGSYIIHVESSHYGRMAVPVIVQAGRKTVLHLDGEWRPAYRGDTNAIVRLPDGEAVGWSEAVARGVE